MQRASVNDVELEYEVTGSGEPVLLISPVLADGFLPLVREPALAGYQLIHYHRRGWVGSTRTPAPVTIEDHAADAAAFIDHLGLSRLHVAGHSSGAAVAAQLALDHPGAVHTLVLLELSLLSLPEGQAFLQGAAPVLEAYEQGDHEGAFAMFMSAASGMDWPACRALLAERIPGVAERSVKDADTFFGVELPSLAGWAFDAGTAGCVRQPVLSVLGSETLPLWVEVAAYLRGALTDVEERRVDGVGHLLHIQRAEPVARAIAGFLGRHPLTAG